jgi:hypothetical protein
MSVYFVNHCKYPAGLRQSMPLLKKNIHANLVWRKCLNVEKGESNV